jgi:uncharacterized repeat protein (TIGR01451 family)/MYXO-CTERM domain-containing protein
MTRSKRFTGVVASSAPALVLAAGLLSPNTAAAETFEAGSLVIPMDTDYQDMGMLEAFGLVYRLLLEDVHVHWVIKLGKSYGDDDFVTSAIDLQTNEVIVDHGYRGGPWVIAATDAAAAKAVIAEWQTSFPTVNVHESTVMFQGDVARTLVVAPTIAMVADGNQKIARKYMQAARIPDSVGDPNWPDSSPDMLTVAELEGPTDTNHADGALFDDAGNPVYCQLMSMHWGVKDAEDHPEVVAEVREFLGHPTHFYAQCQAVNAFENLDPHGFYLTQKGFLIGDRPSAWDFHQMDTPFGQLDGPFESVGGSEPAYSLPEGETYKAQDIVLITEGGTPIGTNDVWMTGLLDGHCPLPQSGIDPWEAGEPESSPMRNACLTNGKVSYLGGHEYDVKVPISANEKTQGTRLFLNSLFEAPCSTEEGFPKLELHKSAPAQTTEAEVTFTLEWENHGPMPVLDVVVVDDLPAGSTFVSATHDGVLDGSTVGWNLGNLASKTSGSVSFTVELSEYGTYENTAMVTYRVGLNAFDLDSNMTITEYADHFPDDTGSDSADGSASADGTGGEAGASAEGTRGASDDTDSTGGTGDSLGSAEVVEGGCSCRTSTPVGALWGFAALIVAIGRRRRDAA